MNDRLLDAIAVIGFLVGLQNLELNITQDDMNAQTADLNARLEAAVADVHAHLLAQDKKIDELLRKVST